VLSDGNSHLGIDALLQCVFPAHYPLEFGQLAHHEAVEVALAQVCGLLHLFQLVRGDLFCQRERHRAEPLHLFI
jgi:hypothetical protein